MSSPLFTRARTRTRILSPLLLLLTSTALQAQWEPQSTDTGVVGLGLALRRLQSTASLLYITAHPDDEDNGLLAKLSRGRGMRVGTLTLTRGEGGQNEIGPELFDGLGVLRSEELLATHRMNGVEQYFGRAVDFGYSFSVDETMEKWGREETLRDIVRVLRSFRPDIVVTLTPDGAGGGQHHQASARLATAAFLAAADPGRYPELEREGLPPWRARKLYRAHWSLSAAGREKAIEVELGDFDPLLGMSYAEFGALARNQHRSQGMNRPPVPGAQSRWYTPVIGGEGEKRDLLAGIPTSLADGLRFLASVPGAGTGREPRLAALARRCQEAFAAGSHSRLPAFVMRGLAEVRRLRKVVQAAELEADARWQADFLHGEEEKDWLDAAAKTHHLFYDAQVGPQHADGLVVPGEAFVIDARLVNRGALPVELKETRIEVPAGWTVTLVKSGASRLPYNAVSQVQFEVEVAKDAPPTMPYWRRRGLDQNRYDSSVSPVASMLPFSPPPVMVVWVYVSSGVEAHVERPVVYRWYDPRAARRRSYAIKVVPALRVRVSPAHRVIPLGAADKAREVDVFVEASRSGIKARVELVLPPSWDCGPAFREVTFERENETRVVRFRVAPPGGVQPGAYEVRAVATANGRRYVRGYETIAYHHIETRHFYRHARMTVKVMRVRVAPGLNIGYVMGVGDRVAAAIEELGARLKLLTADDLASGDLTGYDAIVLGVRAYKDRQDLIASNRRLLDYARGGGVLIVQYNKYEFNRAAYGPYPCSIARPHDRVTDENAPVKVLVPASPVFRTPNRIRAADWEGWVQERGLYFLSQWDGRYTPLLEMEDPFPYNSGAKRGGLLLARYGDGAYVYTGLSFFRQLPAGVPGAYRLVANLISLKASLAKE